MPRENKNADQLAKVKRALANKYYRQVKMAASKDKKRRFYLKYKRYLRDARRLDQGNSDAEAE